MQLSINFFRQYYATEINTSAPGMRQRWTTIKDLHSNPEVEVAIIIIIIRIIIIIIIIIIIAIIRACVRALLPSSQIRSVSFNY